MKETIVITPVAPGARVRTVDDGKGVIEHTLQYQSILNRWFNAPEGVVRIFYEVPPTPEAK